MYSHDVLLAATVDEAPAILYYEEDSEEGCQVVFVGMDELLIERVVVRIILKLSELGLPIPPYWCSYGSTSSPTVIVDLPGIPVDVAAIAAIELN